MKTRLGINDLATPHTADVRGGLLFEENGEERIQTPDKSCLEGVQVTVWKAPAGVVIDGSTS